MTLLPLPSPFTSSPARPEELHEVVAAVSAAREFDLGKSDIGVEAMRSAWESLDLATESVVVRHPDAGVVAYADIDNRSDVLFSIYGDVHPAWRGRGLGPWLVQWGEAFADDRLARAEPGLRACVRHYLLERDTAGLDMLAAAGYSAVRRIDVMEVDLPVESMAGKPAPCNVRFAPFRPGVDEQAAFDAMEDAFRDLWGRPPGSFDRFLRNVAGPDADHGLLLMAWDGDEVAGQAWGSVQDGEGWVSAVGVRERWRRRGIATALLRLIFEAFAQRGIERVGLSVDSESSSRASDVYLAAGMSLTRSYIVMEKTLRDGRELTGQA